MISSSRLAVFVFEVILFLSIVANLVVWYYLAYTRKKEMLGYLSNCEQLRGVDASTVKGRWGHFLMMGYIGNILTFPKLSVAKWGADPDDIKRFPERLRRVIVFSRKLILVQLCSLCVLAAVGACTHWLK